MCFSKLYQEVQALPPGRVSTRWLREKAIQLSSITRIKEQWSGVIDGTSLRGFYIEGPMNPPVPLNPNEALIVVSRGIVKGPQGDYQRRFILTKELMHVFDTAEEKADSPEKLDAQVEKFRTPNAEASIQYRAELKALTRALGVLCQAVQRNSLREKFAANEMSAEVIATALHLPTNQVRNLLSPGFEARLAAVMDN